jgi:hypothetical protein
VNSNFWDTFLLNEAPRRKEVKDELKQNQAGIGFKGAANAYLFFKSQTSKIWIFSNWGGFFSPSSTPAELLCA